MNTTSNGYKFKKVVGDKDSRDVVKDGEIIGRIHFVWSRLGGWGWNSKVFGKTYRTMKDAARDIEKRAAR